MGIFGFDGKLVRANAALLRTSGFNAEELARRPWIELFHPEDKPSVEAMFRKLMGEPGNAEFESRVLCKDGSVVWFLFSASVSPNENLIFTVAHDITDSKRAALGREISNEILRILNGRGSLADSLSLVVAVIKERMGCDAVGIRLQDGDDFPYCAHVGFPNEFILAENSVVERCPDGGVCRDREGRPRLQCGCGLVLAGETAASKDPSVTARGSWWTNDSLALVDLTPSQDSRYRPRNGCMKDGYESVAIVPVRGADRIAGLLQLNHRGKGFFSPKAVEQIEDIAAHIGEALIRKQAEAALRESEANFRELFDGAPVGYHELDMDGVVRRVNRAECSLLGRSEEEILGRPAWAWLDEAEKDASRERFHQKVCGQRALKPYERRFIRTDGAELWVELRDVLVRDSKGDVTGMRTALLDITERKRMADSLAIQAEKLRRSNEELERFAYVASHDLQEPLRMVASFTQLLSQRYSGKLDQTADRYINYAVDGAKRMQQLITDLLTYSRVNNKQIDICPIACAALLDSAMANLQVAVEESGTSVVRETLPEICADKGQFVQLLQNLIGNAIKFRRQDRAPLIHISALDQGDNWRLSVRDNGIGFEPKHSERVFEVFQRLHTRTEYPGTGIGLAICQRIVERHGGKIWAESEPGVGSKFHFTIPKNGRKEPTNHDAR